MNALEVVCTVFVLWICGGAAAESWLTAARERAYADQLNVACDGAEWAAERLLAGVDAGGSFTEDGRQCTVTVVFSSGLCTIRSVCGSAAETLTIPWPSAQSTGSSLT